jgi:cytochrome c-type biogenesis protein CcmE
MSKLDDELAQAAAEAESAVLGVSSDLPAQAGGSPAPSKRKNWALLLGLLGSAGAVLGLVFTSVDGAAIYSVSTAELLKNQAKFDGRTVRVEGDLVKGTLRYRPEPCEYRFTMTKDGVELPVRFPECVIPDTFRDVPEMDVHVTAEGVLNEQGYLDASHIMAKCPSKYEMQQKAARGEAAPHNAMGMPVTAPPIEE